MDWITNDFVSLPPPQLMPNNHSIINTSWPPLDYHHHHHHHHNNNNNKQLHNTASYNDHFNHKFDKLIDQFDSFNFNNNNNNYYHGSEESPHIINISRRGVSLKPPKVFVSYLPPIYTVEDVTRLFELYGTIASIKLLPTPNESLLPLKYRCGFVQFEYESSVLACIAALHQFHLTLDGKRYILTVRNASDQAPVNNTNLMVKGLSPDMSERQLFDTFIQYGRVTSVRIIRDRNNNNHNPPLDMVSVDEYHRRPNSNKGLAFVNYAAAHDAHSAILHLNNVLLAGRRIQVSFAEKEYPYNVHVFDKDPGPEIAALQSGTPVPRDPSAAQYPTPTNESITQDRLFTAPAYTPSSLVSPNLDSNNYLQQQKTVVVVTNVPGWASHAYVAQEFAKFGDLEYLQLLNTGTTADQGSQTAVIAFAHALSAMRAVHTPMIMAGDTLLIVSYAHDTYTNTVHALTTSSSTTTTTTTTNTRLSMQAAEFFPHHHHQYSGNPVMVPSPLSSPPAPAPNPIKRPRTFSSTPSVQLGLPTTPSAQLGLHTHSSATTQHSGFLDLGYMTVAEAAMDQTRFLNGVGDI